MNVALVNEGISSVDSSFQTLISYSPNGQTELSSESDLAKEINRIIQIGNGSIVKSIHDGFRSLDNCPDGGQIEEISPSDFAFGASHDRYVNCANAAVVFDGETLLGEGRNSFITELLEATMTISEPEFLDFTGTIKFTSNRILPDTTTLTGQVEQIDSLGEVITFSGYSAHCKSGAPAQPDRVTIPGNEPEPIASIQTDFESNDNLLDGSRLNVSIEAKFNNQGTVNLQSDNGSTINMIMAGGPFPTVFINLLGENTSEN